MKNSLHLCFCLKLNLKIIGLTKTSSEIGRNQNLNCLPKNSNLFSLKFIQIFVFISNFGIAREIRKSEGKKAKRIFMTSRFGRKDSRLVIGRVSRLRGGDWLIGLADWFWLGGVGTWVIGRTIRIALENNQDQTKSEIYVNYFNQASERNQSQFCIKEKLNRETRPGKTKKRERETHNGNLPDAERTARQTSESSNYSGGAGRKQHSDRNT